MYQDVILKLNNMKQYLLFTYGNFYPSGGFNDFNKSFDTVDEAFNFWENKTEVHYYQIIDKDTFKIIKTNDTL